MSRHTLTTPGPVQMLDRPLAEASASVRPRLDAVDLLRGFVMMLMALDHTRDFFGGVEAAGPAAWAMQSTWTTTVLSFLNCEKYPASLLYLMMTLGPALLLLAAFADARGRLANWITTFGRVPFLYYVAHLFLIHLLAVVYALAVFGDASVIMGPRMMTKPPGYGLPLLGNYVVWLLVVVSLYPLCRWFAGLKQRRRDWWWSYL